MTSRKGHVHVFITAKDPHIHVFQIKLPSFSQLVTVVFFCTTTTGRTTARAAAATVAATAAIVGCVGVGGVTVSTGPLTFRARSCDAS